MALLIKNADLVFDGHGGPPARGQSVLCDGGDIVALGNAGDLDSRARQSNAAVVDAEGMTLIPGLADAHVHLALTEGPGALARVAATPHEDLAASAVLAAQSCLAAGMTLVADCGAPGRVGLAVAAIARSPAAALPEVLSSGPCLTTTGGHGESIGFTADSGIELRRLVRQLSRDGADFIKIMATGGASDPVDTRRGRAQYSVEELRPAIDDAHRLGRWVVCHANGTEGIRNAVRAKADVIAHCNWLDTDGVQLAWDDAVADEMVQTGTTIDLNIAGALATAIDRQSKREVRRWDLLRPLISRGLGLYFSSDGYGYGAASFPRQLARAAVALQLTAEEIVPKVTTIPAQAMGSASAGGIRPGSPANLVLLDGHLDTDLMALVRPAFVILNGLEVARGAYIAAPGAATL